MFVYVIDKKFFIVSSQGKLVNKNFNFKFLTNKLVSNLHAFSA